MGWALNRPMMFGRVLTLKRFAETHFGAQQTAFRLAASPPVAGMQFAYVDNSDVYPLPTTLESILAIRYETLQQTLSRVEDAYESERTLRKAEGNPIPARLDRAFQG
jgi:hypothetical protein